MVAFSAVRVVAFDGGFEVFAGALGVSPVVGFDGVGAVFAVLVGVVVLA